MVIVEVIFNINQKLVEEYEMQKKALKKTSVPALKIIELVSYFVDMNT